MTMLDRMRRHRHWLKWSLALVCLAFVAVYIPTTDSMSGAGLGAAFYFCQSNTRAALEWGSVSNS